jgi:hypothetical protein
MPGLHRRRSTMPTLLPDEGPHVYSHDRSPKLLASSFVIAPSPPSNSVCSSPSSVGACLQAPSRQLGQHEAARLVSCAARKRSNADLALACLSISTSSSPPNSACRPPHCVAACLHAPSCLIFVLLTCNGVFRRLNPIKMWPPGRPLTCSHGCSDWTLCLQAEHMLFLIYTMKWEQIEKSLLLCTLHLRLQQINCTIHKGTLSLTENN